MSKLSENITAQSKNPVSEQEYLRARENTFANELRYTLNSKQMKVRIGKSMLRMRPKLQKRDEFSREIGGVVASMAVLKMVWQKDSKRYLPIGKDCQCFLLETMNSCLVSVREPKKDTFLLDKELVDTTRGISYPMKQESDEIFTVAEFRFQFHELWSGKKFKEHYDDVTRRKSKK